jgi:S-adenosylmethionine:tRNA ribosyltransferase-isomerase
VYARSTGSAAAPTAGLHLTEELLEALRRGGVEVVAVTLHVGTGTFLPIRSEQIEAHVMHAEAYHVPPECALAVNRALAEGRRVLAVGTTAVRTLESAWRDGEVRPGEGQSTLYIMPGYRFRVVSQLLTNFHTPRSTLLVLVSAFAGRQVILRAYREAVRERYRFFSYGDAMLIL